MRKAKYAKRMENDNETETNSEDARSRLLRS